MDKLRPKKLVLKIETFIPNDDATISPAYFEKAYVFFRLISLTFRFRDRTVLDACCDGFAINLRREIGEERILGPEYPGIARINNLYNKKILLKVEKEISIKNIKKIIQNWINIYKKDASFKYVRVIVDVDPQ